MFKNTPESLIVIGALAGSVVLKSSYITGGLVSYFVPLVYWGTITALLSLIAGGFDFLVGPRSIKITKIAVVIAVVQIFLFVDAGILTKFGKSPAARTLVGILLNLIRVLPSLVGLELCRYYLVKISRGMNFNLMISGITLLCTFASTSFTGIFNIQDRYLYVKYLGEVFLPSLSENLLSTYLSLLGGPIAAVCYRMPFTVFMWVSPILPDLPWGFKSLIGVMVPTVGFVSVAATASLSDYIKAGVRGFRSGRDLKEDKNTLGSFIFAAVMVVIVWSSTGLLGFQPRVVVSGSMTPTIQVGDIVVSVNVDPTDIKIGDVLLYMVGPTPIMHRVIEVRGRGTYFITKGDANSVPDDPVAAKQVRGRLLSIIPKIGWVPLYIKIMTTSVINRVQSNRQIGNYALGGLSALGVIIGIRYGWKNSWRWIR